MLAGGQRLEQSSDFAGHSHDAAFAVLGLLGKPGGRATPAQWTPAEDSCIPCGERVRDFRGAWDVACKAAGVEGLLFHDLRRTGARNLRRLGVSEGTAMRIGWWKTSSVFRRYDIVDESDLADAAQCLDEKSRRKIPGISADGDSTGTIQSETGSDKAAKRVQ